MLRTPVFGLLAAFAIWSLLPSVADASIAVDKAEVTIAAGTDREELIVTNTRATPAFVEVSVREILNPGATPEDANRNADPRAIGLLVAPTRLALAPGERRALRLQLLDPARDRDRVWRVLVQEASGPVSSDTSGVVMLIGYDILVIQRPPNPRAVIDPRRDGASVEVTNSGNSYAILDEGRQCAAGGSCTDTVGFRLYPGQTRSFKLQNPTDPVTFRLKGPDGESAVTF